MNDHSDTFCRLSDYLERAMALKTALILMEWDNETLAPEEAGSRTSRMQGALSAAYQALMTSDELMGLLQACHQEDLSENEGAIVREALEEREQLMCIPPEEYRATGRRVYPHLDKGTGESGF